jgi:DNA-binding XRE family transcriptional regulator
MCAPSPHVISVVDLKGGRYRIGDAIEGATDWWVSLAPLLFKVIMGHKKRSKPERLAAKLLAIRQRLGLSQSQIAKRLDFKIKVCVPRISEFEHGVREPDFPLLLSYARLIGISTDVLIDDDLNLPETIKLKRPR